MGLEAVMVCCDNSDYMRNGDYSPSRLVAQQEVVNYICNAKTQSNPESIVGILTMAGKRIDVLVTPSRDMSAMLANMSKVRADGRCNFVAGLKTAHLVLKTRLNKSQAPRIIFFVGSPILHTTKELTDLGLVLKKNNVAVDVINFGDENTTNENVEKLESFINAVNKGDNSHLVNVPPGPHNLSDMVLSSAILSAGAAGMPAGGAAAYGFGDLGFDPSADPELALAMRASMEEEREKQERQAREKAAAQQAAAPAAVAPSQPAQEADNAMEDEDAELARAIAMSMQADAEDAEESAVAEDSSAPSTAATAAAESAAQPMDVSHPVVNSQVDKALRDPSFVDDLLSSLPGVDKNELSIDDILKSITDEPQGDKKQEKK